MKRTDVTYGQLDAVLRSLGFNCWFSKKEPPGRVYEHESGALVTTPPYPMDDFAYDWHLLGARKTVELFGIAEPKVFDAKIEKAR